MAGPARAVGKAGVEVMMAREPLRLNPRASNALVEIEMVFLCWWVASLWKMSSDA